MLKQKSIFEIVIADKTYNFSCDNDSPLGCVHDALMQMKGWVVDRMIAAQKEEMAASEAQKAAEKPEETKAE